MSQGPKLGELLIEAGVITRAQLSQALAHQRTYGGRLGTNMVEMGIVDEKTIAGVLAKQMSVPSATAAQLDRCDPAAIRMITGSVAERLRAVPLRVDSGRLWVAMAEPSDQLALKELEKVSGLPIRAMVAPELLIQYGLEKYYSIRRRPRVMTVTEGSGLIDLNGVALPQSQMRTGAAAPAAKGAPPPPPAEAPTWNWHGGDEHKHEIEALSGYLDEGLAQAAKPRPTLKQVVTELAAATNDEGVFDIAFNYIGIDAPKVAAFLLRNGALVGWKGKGVDTARLRKISTKLDDVIIVAHALSSGEVVAGRITPFDLGPLAASLGVRQETNGLILPVRLGKRAVAALIGLDCSSAVGQTKPIYEKVANKVDTSLHIGYLRRQLLAVDE